MSEFADRTEAGERLASRLPAIDRASSVVVALPRGGVPVGAVVASRLGVSLDVLLIRKVGAPGYPELAVGAVSDGATMKVSTNEAIAAELGLSRDDVIALARAELPELERRRALYFGGRSPIDLTGRTVIVVDDGVATGATMRQALRLVAARKPSRIILALPVAPSSSLDELAQLADETICLAQPEPFGAVGAHYADFDQVDDATVVEILRRSGAGGHQRGQSPVNEAG